MTMPGELDHEANGLSGRQPWDRVVVDAAPRDHIVQLYQDQDFLNRAVCRFAGAAIANGEGMILVPTLTHWNAFRPRLEAEGVDVEAARERGQLTVVDADEFLPHFMRDGMPDSPVFLGLAADVIGQARAGGRYPRDRKSTRLNSSHRTISYAVFCLKKKKKNKYITILHYKKTTHTLNEID